MRRGRRQIGLAEPGYTGTLFCEEICSSYNGERRYVGRGEEIFAASFAISIGDVEDARELYNVLSSSNENGVYCVSVIGADNKRYALMANLSDAEADFDLKRLHTGEALDLVSGKISEKVRLASGESKLYCLI